jgi:hypothetical protein
MLCALVVVLPLWTHRWLPIQDLPEHLATISVIHDVHIGGPAKETFAPDLLHTQYVIFYVLGDLFSYVVTVRVAGLLMLTVLMLGLVASMYALLAALGRDPRLALLMVPILPNTQLVIGLIQFLAGIPFMLYGWSLAIRYREEPRTRTAVGLAVVAVLIFYSHIVAFGLFGIGMLVLAPRRGIVRYLATLVPAGLLCIHWAFFTVSGSFVINAVTSGAENKDLWAFWRSFHQFYDIALDTYRDSADEKVFVLTATIALVLALLAKKQHATVSTLRWLIIPAICVVLFFRSEGTNGFLGHIRDRFAIVAVFSVIPALRMPRGWLGHAGTGAMMVASGMSAETFNWHCTTFERDEVGDFSGALDHIPAGKRVAGLIFDAESKLFYQHPVLHYPAYYLVEKGGMVSFSFAGYSHWPYRFLPHKDPLGASPPVFLWEWQPERVSVHEELAPSYDYVITRGPGFHPPDDLFYKSWEGTGWDVWKRR